MDTAPAPAPVAPAPARRKKNLLPLWILLGVGALLMSGCLMTVVMVAAVSPGASLGLQENVYDEDEGATDKLAMVAIEGVISGEHKPYQKSMTDLAIEQIERATEDDEVKGLLLYLNTPGGEVTASDKIYHACLKFKETGRPIVAYMDTVAASGGYYIACAADEVIASETTITGSIGVIIGGVNAQGMMEKIGVQDQTFKSGAFKDTMSMMRDMREDEKAYIQSLVDATYEKFAGIVSEARQIPLARLKNGIADGRIFHGAQAKEVGLIDSCGYVEDAIAALKTRSKLESAQVIQYYEEPGLADIVSLLGVKAQGEPELKIDWGQGQFTSNLRPHIPYIVLPGY